MERDPYRILGVDRGASDEETHAAYLRCAKTCHPDLNRDRPDAEDRFRAVVEAYEAIRHDRARQRQNEELIRRRRAAAEAEAAWKRRERLGRTAAAPRQRSAPRTGQTDGLIISLLWFLAVMIILAVV